MVIYSNLTFLLFILKFVTMKKDKKNEDNSMSATRLELSSKKNEERLDKSIANLKKGKSNVDLDQILQVVTDSGKLPESGSYRSGNLGSVFLA